MTIAELEQEQQALATAAQDAYNRWQQTLGALAYVSQKLEEARKAAEVKPDADKAG